MITITNLTSGGTFTDANSFNSASITPKANRLILVAVSSIIIGVDPAQPTITGGGMTWSLIYTVTVGSGGGQHNRLSLFRGLSQTAPSTGVFNFDFAGVTQTACSWSINEVFNIDQNGTNGANAIVQSNINSNTGTTTGLSVGLSAFQSQNNAVFGVVHNDGAVAVTAGTNFTQLSASNGSGVYIQTQWDESPQTTVDWTWGSMSANSACIAVELKHGAQGGGFFGIL